MIINPGTTGGTNFTTLNESPNGVLAGGVADKAFDRANSVLYICTTAGGATSAVWTPVLGDLGVLA